MKEFVAITDEMFYNNPELFDRLVPFSHDVACRHLMQQPLDIDGYESIMDFTIIESTGAELQACATH